MKKFLTYWVIFIIGGWGLLFSQDELGVGNLPFDWSGHWGIYHRFGYPGWGQDITDGPLFLDGTFVFWPARYSFPFTQDFQINEDSNSETNIWHRRGDYALDDFALDMKFRRSKDQFIRFQGVKRNFEGEGAFFGPMNNPGGAIEQNYKLTYNLKNDDENGWDLVLAYFKTSHSIPAVVFERGVIPDEPWEKSVSQSDKVLTMGVARSYHRGNFHGVTSFGLFSQRLKLRPNSGLPNWKGDIVSYWLTHKGQFPLSSHLDLTTQFSTKQSYLDSDNLGYQFNKEGTLTMGFTNQTENGSSQGQVGLGFVGNEWKLVGSSKLSRSIRFFTMFIDLNREFVNLPNQMSGARFLSDLINLYPDSKATSQIQTQVHAGISKIWEKGMTTIGVFQSTTSPHYYFQYFSSIDVVTLVTKNKSTIQGGFAKFRWNYFRNWWLSADGLSFFQNEKGWGHGFRHEGEISLSFQEDLFKGRLDAQIRLWADVWLGRDANFVWDPYIFIGYYKTQVNNLPQDQRVLNLEIRGIISSRFEISYTMLNLLKIVEMWSGRKIGKGETEFTASPSFPELGRLAYLTIRWGLSD